jgi:hypothetical protein
MARSIGVVLMVVGLSVTGTAAAEVAPGTMIDASTADQVKDLLPPVTDESSN